MSSSFTGFCVRPRLSVRLPLLFALSFWLLMGLWVLAQTFLSEHLVPGPIYVSLAFFVYFFVTSIFYYFHFRIVMDEEGVVILGASTVNCYAWDDVIGVEVANAYFPGYQVHTRGGGFGFSGLVFKEHRDLYRMVTAYSRRGDMT